MSKSALHCNAVPLVISKWTETEYMQTLLQGRKVDLDERKEEILEILADKYCRTIIAVTMDRPKCAIEISSEAKIPISTVYRRLQFLFDNKILRISGTISDDGKKYFLYKSRIKAISTNFNGSFVEVEIVPNIPKDVMEAKSF